MIRAVILLTLAIVATAGAGAAIMTSIGRSVSWPPMLAAGGMSLLAGIAASAILQFARGASQGGVAQAGLVATMVHLMLCTAAVAVVTLGKVGNLETPFLYWLTAFYLATLIALVIVAVKAVNSAATASREAKQ